MSKIIIVGIQDYNPKDASKQPGALIHYIQNRPIAFKSDAGYVSCGHPVKGGVWVTLAVRGSLKVGGCYDAEFEVQGSGANLRESLAEVSYLYDVELPHFAPPLGSEHGSWDLAPTKVAVTK